MNRYELLERLGDGTFGDVTMARSLKTSEIVAVKKLKALFPTWEQCLQLRELKSLRVLRHENIIQLKEVIRDKEELYYIFEFMDTSLFKVMRGLRRAASASSTPEDSNSTGASTTAPTWFTESQIQSIMFQLFCGLAHMHKHGFFHRDIKPENLLCHEDQLKIADLGQAREIRSLPPYTDYVATRWYRSPELLLRSTTYNSPIDLWACGCIMVELYTRTPLFPGTSEADQLCRIAKVLGTPTKETWPEGISLASHVPFKFPRCAPVAWANVLPTSCSKGALQLIQDLLQFDPSKRPTASQALQHRYFDQHIPRPMLTGASSASVAPIPPGAGSPRKPDAKNSSLQSSSGRKEEEPSPAELASARKPSERKPEGTGYAGSSKSTTAKDWKDTANSSSSARLDERAEAKDGSRSWKPASSVAAASAAAMLAGNNDYPSCKLLNSLEDPEVHGEDDNDEDAYIAKATGHLSSHTYQVMSRDNSLQDLLDEFFTS